MEQSPRQLKITFMLLLVWLSQVGCQSAPSPIVLLSGATRSYTEEDARALRAGGRPIHVSLLYSAEEIDWIARDYVRQKKLDVDISESTATIWVEDPMLLCYVKYELPGKRAIFSIHIGRDGQVEKHGMYYMQ